MRWVRTDGKPVVQAQFEADRAICSQAMQKAAGLQKSPTEADLFRTCMLQHGYIQQVLR
jgi:hypothetical protein